MIHPDMTSLIGNTPLVMLSRFAALRGLPEARIAAKLERQNPCGSAKDRVALNMLRRAAEAGTLKPGGLVIEPTSGNTGIGLAAVCAVLGYRAVIVMPDSMSPERIKLMSAYGAEVVLTPGAEGMSGAIARAKNIQAERGGVIAGQFDNPANPEAHYRTTGPELWRDCGGDIGAFVATVGTGGTISGTGRYLREKKPDIRIIAVEPEGSPVLSGGKSGRHGIQGIGAGFVPAALDVKIYDEVCRVGDGDAFRAMRELAATEGILCGISSGAALCAALEAAARPELRGALIAVLLPDTGERYLSVL